MCSLARGTTAGAGRTGSTARSRRTPARVSKRR